MEFVILILLILLLIILAFWLSLVLLFNDITLKSLNLREYIGKTDFKTLVIYPHPDDETMSAGGLIQELKRFGGVKVITVTKGEFGTELLNLPPDALAKVRNQEFIEAMKSLKVSDYEVWDFVDGTLSNKLSDLKIELESTISSYKPDLIVTYERSGVYGHPDHIALSKVVSEIKQENNSFKVLYSTLPEKILKKIRLPSSINGVPIPEFQKQMAPQYKFFVANKNFAKFSAAKKYKSQNLAHTVPLEVLALVNLFEYYTTKAND